MNPCEAETWADLIVRWAHMAPVLFGYAMGFLSFPAALVIYGRFVAPLVRKFRECPECRRRLGEN